MIPTKIRDNRRNRLLKMTKNLQRLYRENKCTECFVVVTRMDFAKILGKFTKVKIQYESNSTPKGKINNQTVTSPNSRLKRNQNGMVLLHRNAYNPHPVKEIVHKKGAGNETSRRKAQKENKVSDSAHQVNNILKEIKSPKKTPLTKIIDSSCNNNKVLLNANYKRYGIIFENPLNVKINDVQNNLHLTELLPLINKSILPTEDWCIDYLPKDEEPKDDKVYDRIAAELEDLMYNEKPEENKIEKTEATENKVDEFPSIMDILNENTTEIIQKPAEPCPSADITHSLESSDVEAMLLGKPNEIKKTECVAMAVDNSDMNKLIEDVVQLNPIQDDNNALATTGNMDELDNPHSPSILDETLQKGIEEHLPAPKLETSSVKTEEMELEHKNTEVSDTKVEENLSIPNISTITHVVFKRSSEGNCLKSVTCPKNLKYNIEFEGKSIEFLGAPKLISSLEDLQVLLQIVDESDLSSPYVLH